MAPKQTPGQADDPCTNSVVQFDTYPLEHVYRLVEPDPVLLVATGSLHEVTHNIMAIGFHMMMQHESPPLIDITLGPWDTSFALLQKYRTCVLAIPSVEMASDVVDIGNCSAADADADGDKWKRFALEARPIQQVATLLIAGPHILANIECVVEDTAFVRKYAMWALRPVKAWTRRGEPGTIFHHRGQGIMVTDGEVIDLSQRMVEWQEFLD
ncbi:uncharacterized protein N7483_008870 [Penicillium malachiteum]|uniref:uncharacterized protein n=1 Tax=Penicillium malachiteum TaxID=1324776 RepID=UPI002548AC8A|nr:uncharacterized protein N7483_008870 [Penicillium malachiteum]KAJ5720936.1 hypothetical protein N7483_008870 [Penicillium malachiteum]